MVSKFPQELLDTTIDYVDPTDHYRCALVAQSWRPRSQSHIFHTVTLGMGLQGGYANGLMDVPPLEGEINNFTAFWKLLQKSPHLGQYVRNLVMGLSVPYTELQASFASSKRLLPASWQAIKDMVADILPMLNRLDSLALFPCGPAAFHSLELPEHLSNLFAALSLKSLTLCQWRLPHCPPLSIFQSGLSSLRFLNCQFEPPVAPIHLSPCMTTLTTLDLVRCAGVDLFYRDWVPQNHWRVNNMTMEPLNQGEMAMRALQYIALGVAKDLTIKISEDLDPSPFFDLSSLSHSGTLHLSFDANEISEDTVAAWLQVAMGSIELRSGMTLQFSLFKSFSVHGHTNFITTLNMLQPLNPTLRFKSQKIDLASSGYAYLTEQTYISAEDAI